MRKTVLIGGRDVRVRSFSPCFCTTIAKTVAFDALQKSRHISCDHQREWHGGSLVSVQVAAMRKCCRTEADEGGTSGLGPGALSLFTIHWSSVISIRIDMTDDQ